MLCQIFGLRHHGGTTSQRRGNRDPENEELDFSSIYRTAAYRISFKPSAIACCWLSCGIESFSQPSMSSSENVIATKTLISNKRRTCRH
mmetsp:Transcript_11666/g.23924  ORF Transcript_11666/g.23924 Transcript_11666/m.23924 type:complete len:89 (+) Transcript_11666:507-773(+)